MRFLKSAVLAVAAGAGVIMAQSIDPDTLPECASTCLTNMLAKFGDFACTSADDTTCLCQAADWRLGISSCASGACGEESEGFLQVTTYANELCAIVTGTLAGTTATETISSPTEATSDTTTDTAAIVSASTTPTTLLTSTTDADSAATSSSSSEESDGGDDSDGGISTGAKIGISVGAGAAGMILLALLLALCCRRRDRKKTLLAAEKDMSISGPMPGSGRSYASDDGSTNDTTSPMFVTRSKSTGKGGHDLELNSTRYENMVPRTQPSLTDIRN